MFLAGHLQNNNFHLLQLLQKSEDQNPASTWTDVSEQNHINVLHF